MSEETESKNYITNLLLSRPIVAESSIGLDGKWSTQTKVLLKNTKAKLLQLNKWWALTPQDWVCSCCKRTKPQIARSTSDKLIANLVAHHDHIEEFYKEFSSELKSKCENEQYFKNVLEILKRFCREVLPRFEPTIICEDCNNVEVKIKSHFNIPMDITLNLLEISQCIEVQHNKTHIISEKASINREALLAWKITAKNLCQLIIEGSDESTHGSIPNYHFYGRRIRTSAQLNLRPRAPVTHNDEEALSQFLKHSCSDPSEVQNKRRKILPSPSASHFDGYKNPNPSRQKDWFETPNDWICPICQRSKFAVFRSSRSHPNIFHGNIYPVKLEDEEILDSEIVPTKICHDCNDMPRQLRAHAVRFQAPAKTEQVEFVCRSPQFLRQIIMIQAHQPHIVDFDKAIKLLNEYDAMYDLEIDF